MSETFAQELPKGSPFVGMPELLKLNEFGGLVAAAFGVTPCLVGSSLVRKEWRDVDVRLVLPNNIYCRVFELQDEVAKAIEDSKSGKLHLDSERDVYAHVAHCHHNKGDHSCPRWVALVRAFTALGREMTGLPIDFQIECHFSAEQLYPFKSNRRYRLWSLADRAHVRDIQ